MKELINEILTSDKKTKTVQTDVLLKEIIQTPGMNREGSISTQMKFQKAMLELIEEGILKPINPKETWGYNNSLARKYKINQTVETLSEEEQKELMTKYHPSMVMKYYFTRPEQYREDRKYLLRLSEFLITDEKDSGMTTNERSVAVFKDEKYLHSKGKTLLKRVGLGFEIMNRYDAVEPFMYFAVFGQEVSNALVIENKDTYDSFVRLLIEGRTNYYGIEFQMVIYGQGNKCSSSLGYLSTLRLDHINVYYYGDFDKSGLQVYSSVVKNFGDKYNIQLFKEMYEKLWSLRLDLPQKKEQQNVRREVYVNLLNGFEAKDEMIAYLDKNYYAPQECTNVVLLRELSMNGIK